MIADSRQGKRARPRPTPPMQLQNVTACRLHRSTNALARPRGAAGVPGVSFFMVGFHLPPVSTCKADGKVKHHRLTSRLHIRGGIAAIAVVAAFGAISRPAISADAQCLNCDGQVDAGAKYTLSIEEELLGDAVRVLAEQTGLELLFSYELATTEGANPVHGSYTVDEALSILLNGSGFSGGLTERGVITITHNDETQRQSGENDMINEETRGGLRALLSGVSGVVLAAVGAGQGAFGQDGSGDQARAEVDIITVTAQKREESIQDVPITMQAFGGDEIRDLKIRRASDITRLAPNINQSGQNNANRQISIRGVGTNDFFGNATGSVGVYMDEVTMSAPYLSSLGLYDIERVEILRGPQNSLFGRNTTGGAVNYISVQPVVGDPVTGFAEATFGNFSRYEFEGAVAAPLGEQAAIRIAAKSFNRDGIWNNLGDNGADFGEKDQKSIRGTVRWEPSDLTAVTLNLHYAREDSDFDPVRAVGLRGENGSPNFGLNGIPAPFFQQEFPPTTNVDFTQIYPTNNAQGNNPSTDRWEDVYVTGTHVHDVEAYGFFAKVEHEFDFATFTSITSFDESDVLWTYDTGGVGNTTPTAVSVLNGDPQPSVVLGIDQDQEFEQWSQEFRFVSSGDGALRWIAGLYLFGEDSVLSQNIRFGPFGFDFAQPDASGTFPGQPIGGSLGLAALTGNPYGNQMAASIAKLENFVWSPYLHSDFDVTDKLTFTLGLRYTNDTKKMPNYTVANLSTAGDPITTIYDRARVLAMIDAQVTPECDTDNDGNITNSDPTATPELRGLVCTDSLAGDELDFSELGGKAGVDYHLTEDWMVYGSYSRGFRSGKHDIEFLHGPHTGFIRQDLDVETLDAFEIGSKMAFLDNTLQLNLAAFFNIWKDQQTFVVDPLSGPIFANIPESEIKGLEIEGQWLPLPDLGIRFGVGLLDTEITEEGTGDTDPTDPAGERQLFDELGAPLPFSPEVSANIGIVKDFMIGGNMLSVSGDWQYRSSTTAYPRTVNYVNELNSSTNFFNARASYTFGDVDQYELSVFGENITEEESCLYAWDLAAFSGTTYCVPNEAAAFYGVTLGVEF